MKKIISLFVVRIMILQMVFVGNAFACRRAWNPRNTLPRKLITFNTCDALKKHISKINKIDRPSRRNRKGSFVSKVKKALGSSAKLFENRASSVSSDRASGVVAEKEANAPSDIIGTNNQVAKVDEADFVKFNGQHIFQLYKGSLKILKAWPANSMNLISSVKVEGHPQEMLINDNNAVVLANKSGKLIASIFDITEIESPRLKTRFEIPGTYKTAHLVGDTLRVINYEYTSTNNLWKPQTVEKSSSYRWFEAKPGTSMNIQPTVQVTGENRQEIDTSNDCNNVWVPEKSYAQILTRIIRIDLSRKKYDETLAFINPAIVYASEKNIYLAALGNEMLENRFSNQQMTSIHKFSMNDGGKALYRGTGVVKGALVNQFALDEYKNDLRVATNGTEKNEKGHWKKISRVQVLRQEGKKLVSIGKTKDMADGERLYSVRFDDEQAYVVTFRQIDPLFTLDLSNPKNPKVVGELKVPGFSTYIHKLDSTHLLTIGKDADIKTGRAQGIKLSIFDVSDFAKPREVKSLVFKKNVSSEASYEHKAFSFYRKKGILAIPATTASEASALLLFNVGQENIRFTGELDMTDMFSQINSQSQVRRSFFADHVVYAIGESGVRAADLSQPQKPLSTVHFEKKMAHISW